MAETAIEFIVQELLVQLKACTVLKAKCRTLTGFLVNLQSELPKMKDFDEGLLEMEATLNQLKDVLDCISQKRRGKLSRAVLFFMSRKKVDELDECHMKLVELLEQFRIRQANRLERNMDQVKNILERLEEQSRSDNRADLKEDRAMFLTVLEKEGGNDKEVAELLQIGEEMDEEELDAALKTVSRAKLLMESIATRTQMEECTLQANISPSDLTVYEDDILGNGSFGEVLAGKLGDQLVAIKRALAMSMMSFKAQDDLRKEAEKWQTLDHKNIVRLLGTCIYENKLLLVMEKCDMTLFDLLYTRTELLSLDCFETIARGVLRGLVYLHGKQFIHRDLKPMNILLSYDLGRVKLSDFGLLAAKEEYATYAKTSTVRGTWLYMAPEVLDEPARWTTRADMYSFALVCWEILHREIPWGSNTNPLVLSKKIARGERPAFSDNVVLKPWQLELIQKCWEQEPRNRPSASDALATIEKKAPIRRSTKILKGMLSFLKKTGSTAMDNLRSEAKIQDDPDLPLPRGKPGESDIGRAVQAMRQSNRFRAGLKLLLALIESEQRSQQDDTNEVKSLRKAAWKQGASAVLMTLLTSTKAGARTDQLRDALRALAFMMQTEDKAACAKELVAEHDADKVVLQLLRTFPGNPEILAEAFFTLKRLSLNVDNMVTLMRMGAADAILQAMRTHSSHAGVQENACGALGHLAYNSVNKVTLMRMGTADPILQAMRTHSSHAGVQEHACGALWNLANNADNKVTLMRMGAADAILQAMRTHSSHAGVQEKACGALLNLAVNADNKVTLLRMGAADAIPQAMRTHTYHAGVQEQACGALGNLAFNADDYQVTLMQMGAVDAILRAMRTHASHAGVQKNACGALWNLAANDDNQVTLMRMGAAGAILQAMRTHSSHAGVQQYARGALKNLALNVDNKVTLLRMGAIGGQMGAPTPAPQTQENDDWGITWDDEPEWTVSQESEGDNGPEKSPGEHPIKTVADHDDDEEADPIPKVIGFIELERKYLSSVDELYIFLTRSLPKNLGTVKCKIKRSIVGLQMNYNLYELYLEHEDGTLGPQIMIAQKYRKYGVDSYYNLAIGSVNKRESGKVISSLIFNTFGTHFLAHNDVSSHKGKPRDLAGVVYQRNFGKGPRNFQVAIPALREGSETEQVEWAHHGSVKKSKLIQSLVSLDFHGLQPLVNKKPTWSKKYRAWTLNFHGRVTRSSVKNFQLVRPDDDKNVVLQFGRIGTDTFTMDLSWPLSPTAAFAICVSSLHSPF